MDNSRVLHRHHYSNNPVAQLPNANPNHSNLILLPDEEEEDTPPEEAAPLNVSTQPTTSLHLNLVVPLHKTVIPAPLPPQPGNFHIHHPCRLAWISLTQSGVFNNFCCALSLCSASYLLFYTPLLLSRFLLSLLLCTHFFVWPVLDVSFRLCGLAMVSFSAVWQRLLLLFVGMVVGGFVIITIIPVF